MSLIGIVGRQGHGKTITASILASYTSRVLKSPVYSDYPLKGAKRIITKDQLMNISSGIVVLDEFHQNIDSRDYKNNIFMSNWITKLRKKDLITFYTTQDFGQVDKRVRQNTQHLILCQKSPNGDIWLTFVDMYTGKFTRRFLIDQPERFFSLYDSYFENKPLL